MTINQTPASNTTARHRTHPDEQDHETALAAEWAKRHPSLTERARERGITPDATEFDVITGRRITSEEVPDLMAALAASVSRIKDARTKNQPKTNEEQA